tara:strand:- start:783 stop:1220 length:438 start_codon:yes stop_codon:yes gene_type:complete
MQTFVPEAGSYRDSARTLDRARLGKQRVEALQILHALDPEYPKSGWSNHPAVQMWSGHMGALARYALACVEEWVHRGYRDIKCGPQLRDYAARYPDATPPPWWGDQRVHRSHRSRLIQKKPEHYRPLWPGEAEDLEYFWPCKEQT